MLEYWKRLIFGEYDKNLEDEMMWFNNKWLRVIELFFSQQNSLTFVKYFEYKFKNNHDFDMKIFPYETIYPQLSKGIYIVENEQRMKMLCPIEVGEFSNLSPQPLFNILTIT